jgi:hypothetical protein
MSFTIWNVLLKEIFSCDNISRDKVFFPWERCLLKELGFWGGDLSSGKTSMFLRVDVSPKLNIPEGMASRGDISTRTMWLQGVVISPETNVLLEVVILLTRGELS